MAIDEATGEILSAKTPSTAHDPSLGVAILIAGLGTSTPAGAAVTVLMVGADSLQRSASVIRRCA